MQLAEQLNSGLAGRYDVQREIGSGGMAIVYQARDLRHDRLVALKVLRPELGVILGATRFLEEIRVTAHLQHPNLLPLFDSGEVEGLLFYVMPYVEGESLRQRLTREVQLSIDDAVHIGAAIAGALDYAHSHGVIHRDLKPENILLQRGEPMLADFGIALAVRRAAGERITESGISLGTPSYMSPEQATGDRVIDGRSDIYSLAAVIYEMLTGDPPHAGSSAQSVIAKVVTEPAHSVRIARPKVPEHVAGAIARGLEKVPGDRWPTAGAFADALTGGKRVSAADVPSFAPTPHRRERRRATLFTCVGVIAGATLASLGGWLNSPKLELPLAWHTLVLPDSIQPLSLSESDVFGHPVALSPDGSTLVYVAHRTRQLVIRRVDDLLPRALIGTEGAACPQFSPDGRWLVYVTDQGLFKVRVNGGAPLALADSAVGCAVWTEGDEVVFDFKQGLYRVPANGGQVSELLRRNTNGVVTIRASQALPGGRTVLVDVSPTRTANDYQIGIVSLPNGALTRLTAPESDGEARFNATYSSGYLVFEHGKSVVAAPFSLRSLKITGPEVTVLRDTVYGFVTSRSGNAAYRSEATPVLSLVAVTLNGGARPLSGAAERSSKAPSALDTAHYAWPRLSPDGKRVALELSTGTHTWDVSVYDLLTRSLSRLTTNFTGIRPQAWSADGQRLIYFRLDTASVTAPRHLVSQPWDGSSPPRELFAIPPNTHDITFGPPHGFAVLSLTAMPPHTGFVLLPIDTPVAAHPLLPAQPHEAEPRLSPNGQLLAYTADETQRAEVYIRPLRGGNRIQVSRTGGDQPVWSPDGASLFYRGPEYMMRVSITQSPTLRITRRDTVFRDTYERHDITNYDVFPSGNELLMIQANRVQPRIAVIQNWPQLLRQGAAIH